MSDKIEETTLDESSVTAGAKPADPQGKASSDDGSSLGGVQDLGGPTPQNSADDDSNKYKIVAKSASAPTTKPSDASASKQDTLSKKLYV